MSDKEKELMFLADTLKGEINRMCVTKSLTEFDTMYGHAKRNLDKLSKMIYDGRFKEEVREEQAKTEQLEHDILYEPTYNPEDGSM